LAITSRVSKYLSSLLITILSIGLRLWTDMQMNKNASYTVYEKHSEHYRLSLK